MCGLKFVLVQRNQNDLGILEKGESIFGGMYSKNFLDWMTYKHCELQL